MQLRMEDWEMDGLVEMECRDDIREELRAKAQGDCVFMEIIYIGPTITAANSLARQAEVMATRKRTFMDKRAREHVASASKGVQVRADSTRLTSGWAGVLG